MKKILHVIRNISDGGTEKFMQNIIENTNNEYNHYIISYKKVLESTEFVKKNNVYLYDLDEKNILKVLIKTYRIIKKEKIDIIHCYTHYNSGYVMLIAFLAGVKKRITHSHRSESTRKKSILNNIYKFISRLLINIFSNICLACGEDAAKSLFYKSKNVTIINNGIELNKYKFDSKKRVSLRKKLNILENDIVLGTIGRLDYNKNQKFLIDIFNELTKKNTNMKLIIIGEGYEKNNLANQTKKLGISDKVLFLGSRRDVNELYNIFDIFCLTSFKEGLPFVLIESQANGLSCVVSDTVDKKSDLDNNIKFISLNSSKEEWIEEINGILKNKKRKDNTKKIIEREYTIEKTIEKIKKIYN